MKKIVIATHNKHKIFEFTRILEPMGIKLITADLPEVEETGTTFEENSFLKAKAIYDATEIAAIADDSGLSVDVLNGEPGVYSARYSGEHGNDKSNRDLLLKNLEKQTNRKKTTDFIGGFSALVHKGYTKGDYDFIETIPEALCTTNRICSSVNVNEYLLVCKSSSSIFKGTFFSSIYISSSLKETLASCFTIS